MVMYVFIVHFLELSLFYKVLLIVVFICLCFYCTLCTAFSVQPVFIYIYCRW